jgi:cation:H+ antiporter
MKLSKILGISEMSAGFIILSVSTSLPELMVSTISAASGNGGLGIGNILGANIADVTLVLGLALLISRRRRMIFNERVFENMIQFLFVSSLIPLFILQTGQVNFLFGIILIILFVFFTIKMPKRVVGSEKIGKPNDEHKFLLFVKFALAVTGVVLASRLIVDHGVLIANSLGVPLSVIGATIVSIGTTLPELTTTVQAFRKKLFDVGLGNVIGSCITNLTLVLGLSSLFQPTAVNVVSFTSLILFAILATMITWYFISTGRRLDRREAGLLLGLYAIFILQELGFSIFVL